MASMVRHLVLGLLRNGESLHGYALVRAYRALTGLEANSGNFYRELQRLAGQGLVRAAAKSPETDPRRTPYEISDSGTEDFDAWFADPSDHEEDFSLRVLFIANVNPGLAHQVLDQWRDGLWLRSQVLERERKAARVRGGKGALPAFPARASFLAHRLKQVVANLDFLEEFRVVYDTWLKETESPAGARVAAAPVTGMKPRPHTKRPIRQR